MNPAVHPLRLGLCLALLFMVTLGVFSYTVSIRKPWFGTLSLKNHHVLTGDTLKFTQYWYHETPWKLKFGMFRYPSSVEYPTLESRVPYVSYPVGALIPIYLISEALQQEPSPSIVMGYNLANHFLVSLALGWIAFFFCLFTGLPLGACCLFALTPVFISQLMPSPLYFQQNVFWSDQAIILPFVLFALLEFLRDHLMHGKNNRAIMAGQAGLLFYGAMTDWLFFVLAGVVYLKRLGLGEYAASIKQFLMLSLKFWAPVAAALGLFLFHVWSLNGIPLLIERYQLRTGQSAEGHVRAGAFLGHFWGGHIADGFGGAAIMLIWGSLLACLTGLIVIGFGRCRRRDVPQELYGPVILATLVLIPCFLQVGLLKNHSFVHNFSALKFVVPLALVPFVILPVTAAGLWFRARGTAEHLRPLRFTLLAVFCLATALAYACWVHPGYKTFFSDKNPVFEQLGGFIARNTGHDDIVFSTQGGIDENPLFLIYSKKRVYWVRNVQQIFIMTRQIKGPYTINILTTAAPEADPGIQKLMSMAFDIRRQGALALYKIKGQ